MSDFIAVCGNMLPVACRKKLKSHGIESVIIAGDHRLQRPVVDHTDLSISVIEDTVVMRRSSENLALLKDVVNSKGMKLVETDEIPSATYPYDTGLCAAVAGNNIICRGGRCDHVLEEVGEELGYGRVSVSQGYTKCSCATLYDGSVITEDPEIARTLAAYGVECLVLKDKYASLPGYDSEKGPAGFIGGSSGLCGHTLYFSGCIENHPEYDRIAEFCRRHGTVPVSLSSEPLLDVGTIFFI